MPRPRKTIVIPAALPGTKDHGRPRYVNLEQDVARQLDELAARTGRSKFWLANHLLREAFKLAKPE